MRRRHLALGIAGGLLLLLTAVSAVALTGGGHASLSVRRWAPATPQVTPHQAITLEHQLAPDATPPVGPPVSITVVPPPAAPVELHLNYPGTPLRLGSTGDAVVMVQRRLGITADGIFGRQTRHAVIAWQQAHGLDADGVVGPKTWASLFG